MWSKCLAVVVVLLAGVVSVGHAQQICPNGQCPASSSNYLDLRYSAGSYQTPAVSYFGAGVCEIREAEFSYYISGSTQAYYVPSYYGGVDSRSRAYYNSSYGAAPAPAPQPQRFRYVVRYRYR